MTPSDLLHQVVAVLEELEIPYMLTGSLAGAVHGVPRATLDLDFVIDPSSGQWRDLVRRFPPPRFHADEHAARDAMAHRAQFNVIDVHSGLKVDLIFMKDRPFSRSEFARRQRLQLAHSPLEVVSREDLILAKLEWARMGESARQVEDVASLLRLGWESLDQGHLALWIPELGVRREWDEALRRAFPRGAPTVS